MIWYIKDTYKAAIAMRFDFNSMQYNAMEKNMIAFISVVQTDNKS